MSGITLLAQPLVLLAVCALVRNHLNCLTVSIVLLS